MLRILGSGGYLMDLYLEWSAHTEGCISRFFPPRGLFGETPHIREAVSEQPPPPPAPPHSRQGSLGSLSTKGCLSDS